jgi:hypothetical protein
MIPKKKIPSFCFESPHLKPFNLDLDSVEVTVRPRTLRASWTPELTQDVSAFHNIDAEAELTRMLSEELSRGINREITNTITQDLVTVQPMGGPQGNLFYYDYIYGAIEEPVVYDDGSWSIGDTFEGSIGIKSEIKLPSSYLIKFCNIY